MTAGQSEEPADLPESITVETGSSAVPPERSRSIITAVAMWIVATLLFFGSAIVLLVQQNVMVAEGVSRLEKRGTTLSHDQVVAGVQLQMYLFEVLFFVFAALTAIFLAAFWRFRRWARIALWVLAALETLVVLFLSPFILSLVATLFTLVAAALVSTPANSKYLADMNRLRREASVPTDG